MKNTLTIFWFRRDLRLSDNRGLHYALQENTHVFPVFIFDTEILNNLESNKDQRVEFIYQTILELKRQLEELGTSLLVLHGEPSEIFSSLIQQYNIRSIYFNKDYEPYAIQRDNKVNELFKKHNLEVKTYKDQVIFEKDDILKDDGEPYSVFTPYMKRWRGKFDARELEEYSVSKLSKHFYKCGPHSMPALEAMHFQHVDSTFPAKSIDEDILKKYDEKRDYPYLEATSRLGVHLRFGTISIRKLIRQALEINEVWLNQLIWREFFMMILWHHPQIVDQSFKKKYDFIDWRNNEKEFHAWCEGRTGYPFVDAGMRQLNETGYMHNRARMITASFLTKHLLIDWRWGEAYFAQKLLDYELASNNGGWQWAAGSGCDAAPYFRIFNPERQMKRFDPEMKYIRRWVKEYGTDAYPEPIVEHKFARERALKEYKKALNQ